MKGLLLLLAFAAAPLFAQAPVLLFTDLFSGPATGNSDNSQSGQVAGQDGAIVTVWGKNLGATPGTITVGGQVARIYSWGNATGPADLYTRHKMQMVSFQVPHGLSAGATTIQATVGGIHSNNLPFTVRSGGVYFVATAGNDLTGTGSWSAPWHTISQSALNLNPGDTLYVRNGVQQITDDSRGGCSGSCAMVLEYGEDSSQFATQAMPKAIIAYPGATAQIGSASLDGYGTYQGGSEGNTESGYWTIAKMTLIGVTGAAAYGPGFRLIGNHISAPNGDGETGALAGGDSTNLFILGNELTECGYPGTSKKYHPLYVQSLETRYGNAVTAASETGTTVTLTLGAGNTSDFTVGGWAVVLGMAPDGYNGNWAVTNVTASQVQYTAPAGLGTVTTLGTAEARWPDEPNREIGWNYLHDNYAYDGINIYREGTYAAFMLHTSVHDNWVMNQTGRGMLIGSYIVGPDNYFYNNVIVNAGQGPNSTNYPTDWAFNFQCVYFSAGYSAYPGTTTVHFYNNTLYNCGYNDPYNPSSSSAMISYDNTYPFTLDFRNNIVEQASGFLIPIFRPPQAAAPRTSGMDEELGRCGTARP